MFAADTDTTFTVIPLTAQQQGEPWRFAVLQANWKLNGNALIPVPSHSVISVLKGALTPKRFGAPSVWGRHTTVV